MTPESGILSWVTGLDPRIWQAVVAGGFVALGWLINGWRARREAASLRAERLRDVHRALYAEIGANLSNLVDAETLDRERDAGLARIAEAPEDAPYVPFIGRESRDQIFQAIVSDIHILPRTSIDAVVPYYAQIAAISAIIEDLRGPTYASLSKDRRMQVYADYMAMKQQALTFGNHALRMITAYAAKGAEYAKELEATLRDEAAAASIHPDADRSDP